MDNFIIGLCEKLSRFFHLLHINSVTLMVFGIVLLVVCFLLGINNERKRKQKEKEALKEIKFGMKKEEVDNILGYNTLEKTTKTYTQYRYMEVKKIGNTAFSLSSNLRSGRTYFHNRKSYLSIKYSNDTQEVIEIINKL